MLSHLSRGLKPPIPLGNHWDSTRDSNKVLSRVLSQQCRPRRFSAVPAGAVPPRAVLSRLVVAVSTKTSQPDAVHAAPGRRPPEAGHDGGDAA